MKHIEWSDQVRIGSKSSLCWDLGVAAVSRHSQSLFSPSSARRGGCFPCFQALGRLILPIGHIQLRIPLPVLRLNQLAGSSLNHVALKKTKFYIPLFNRWLPGILPVLGNRIVCACVCVFSVKYVTKRIFS